MYELCVSNGYGVSFLNMSLVIRDFRDGGCAFMYVLVWHSFGIVFNFCRLFCQSLGNGFMLNNCISE